MFVRDFSRDKGIHRGSIPQQAIQMPVIYVGICYCIFCYASTIMKEQMNFKFYCEIVQIVSDCCATVKYRFCVFQYSMLEVCGIC